MEIINGVKVVSAITTDGDLTVTNGDLVVTGGDIDLIHVDKKLLLPVKNDAANPTLAFGDGNTGLYESSDNYLSFATSGARKALITSVGNLVCDINSGWGLLYESSTDINPTIIPYKDDEDTGIGHAATDQLSLIAGGLEGIRVTGNGAVYTTQLGGQVVHKTDGGAADYNPSALTSDYIITVDTTSAARAVTISAEDWNSGTAANPRIFIIKDIAGNAGTHNITVSLETSSGNIDGAGTAVINANYGSITLVVDGTNGFII